MERIWFDGSREHFFSIPDHTSLPEGALSIRTVTGQHRRVDPEAVAPYGISRAEATDRLGAQLDEVWGSLVGAVDRVLTVGRQAARQAGVRLDEDSGAEGGARPPLPEHLADLLGIEPGELLTDPEKVRARLREVAAQAGIHIRPRSEPSPTPAADTDAAPGNADAVPGDTAASSAPADAEEVHHHSEGGERAESPPPEGRAPEPDPLREFLRRPEVSEAISGFGRALSRLGSRLQDASRPTPPPSPKDRTPPEDR